MASQPISLMIETVADQAPQALIAAPAFLPDAYRLPGGMVRRSIAAIDPRVVFIEVTNRCNLLCET